MNEHVVVIDFEVDSISVYNNKGTFIQSKPFSVGIEIKDVWQDISNGGIYLYIREKGDYKIFSLDVLTGETFYLLNLKGYPYAKLEKIYDGWLYR